MNVKVMDKVTTGVNTIVWKGKTLARVTFQEILGKLQAMKISCPVSDEVADLILELVPQYQTKDDGSVRSHDWDAIKSFQKGEELALLTYVARVASKPVTPRGQGNPITKLVKVMMDKGMSKEEIASKLQSLL